MAATPPSQVRGAPPGHQDDADEVDAPLVHGQGARLDMRSDDERSGAEDEEGSWEEEDPSAASVSSSMVAKDRKLDLVTATAPDEHAVVHHQTIAGWCLVPCVALFVMMFGIGGAIAYVGKGIDAVHQHMTARLAARGAHITGAAVHAVLDLYVAAGQLNGTTAGQRDAVESHLSATIAPLLTFSREAIGDAIAVQAAYTANGQPANVTPMHANVFGPTLCADCPHNARFSLHEISSWWCRAPATWEDGPHVAESKVDPAIDATSSASLISLRRRALTTTDDGVLGPDAHSPNYLIQYSVNHVIARGVVEASFPPSYPAAAGAAVALGILLPWACVVVALELVDRFFLARWSRGATVDEVKKMKRLDDGEELDVDETDVPASVVSARRQLDTSRAQRVARALCAAGLVFCIVALWGASAVALTFAPSEVDARAAATVIVARSEASLLAAALDTVVGPAAAEGTMASLSTVTTAYKALQPHVSSQFGTGPAPSAVVDFDETTRVATVRITDEASHAAVKDMGDWHGPAIGLAFAAAFATAGVVFAGLLTLHTVPEPLTTVTRRNAVGQYISVGSSRFASAFATVLSLPFTTGVVLSAVLIAVAVAVAAGSVVLLRAHAFAEANEAVLALSHLTFDIAGPANAVTPASLREVSPALDTSRRLYSVRIEGAMSSAANPPVFTIVATDDIQATCGGGPYPVGEPFTLASVEEAPDLNLRLLMAGQPPILSATVGAEIASWAVPVSRRRGNELRPRNAQRTPLGTWGRTTHPTVEAGTSIVLHLVEQKLEADNGLDMVRSLPVDSNRVTFEAIAAASFPRVVWIPLGAVLSFIAVMYAVSDIIVAVAAHLRQKEATLKASHRVAGAAFALPLVVVGAIVWPITASVTFQQEWDSIGGIAADAELRATARAALSMALLPGNLGAKVAVVNTSVPSALSALDVADSASSTHQYTWADQLSAFHRRGGAVVMLAIVPSGAAWNKYPAAALTQNEAVVAARSLRLANTNGQCSPEASGAALAALCKPTLLFALRAEAASRAYLGEGFGGNASSKVSPGLDRRGNALVSSGVAVVDGVSIKYGYAAELLATSIPSDHAVLAEILVATDENPSVGVQSSSSDARQALAVRVVATVCVASIAVLAVVGMTLMPAAAVGRYEHAKLGSDRPVRLAAGFFSVRAGRTSLSPKLHVPIVGAWRASKYLPLPMRRREVFFALMYAGALLVAAGVADLSLGYMRRTVENVALSVTSSEATASGQATASVSTEFGPSAQLAADGPNAFAALTPAGLARTVAAALDPSAAAATDQQATSGVTSTASANRMIAALAGPRAAQRRAIAAAFVNAESATDLLSGRKVSELFRATVGARELATVAHRLVASSMHVVALFNTAHSASLTVLDWAKSIAKFRATGAENETTHDALWTSTSGVGGDWSSTFAAHVLQMADALNGARHLLHNHAFVTISDADSLLSSLDLELLRAAAAATDARGALDSTAASPPVAVTVALTRVATVCAELRPFLDDAEAAAIVVGGQLAALQPTEPLSLGSATYTSTRRAVAELSVLRVQAATVMNSFAGSIAAFNEAALTATAAFVDGRYPLGFCGPSTRWATSAGPRAT
jgi:hypothetical protein